KAIEKPGALKATAKAASAIKDDGTIEKDWLKKKSKGSGKTAKRARLAMTLGKMKHEDVLMSFLETEEITQDGDELENSNTEELENEGDIKSKSVLKNLVKNVSRRLIKYKPGLEINISYSDQKDYTYKLTKRVGSWPEFPMFKPELTPVEILKLGVFQGKRFNDCFREFPREWFLEVLEENKLSVLKPMRKFNYFKVPEDVIAVDWKDEDHDSLMDQHDPRGWLQWYIRFHLGRRTPVDRKQINRWVSFGKRYKKMIESSCKKGDDKCKTRIKQAMICWGFDPKKF
ncbi:MAG: hypothetical protein GX638_17395, partial [Crenarchaeota archaeon]|nr:hypothetical protein [Thermoproteota archaeon]